MKLPVRKKPVKTRQAGKSGIRRSSQSRTDTRNQDRPQTAADAFWEEKPTRISHQDVEARIAARRNQQRTSHMNLGYVLFMVILLGAMTVTLIGYITLRSDLSTTRNEITELEAQLSELKAANDETYNEINNSIDMEKITDRAINDLGMQYAEESQIVTYSGNSGDSVHQVSDLDN